MIDFTQRESEVIKEWLKGNLQHKIVAKNLEIKTTTIISHSQRIFRKLDVNSVTEAVLRLKDAKINEVA